MSRRIYIYATAIFLALFILPMQSFSFDLKPPYVCEHGVIKDYTPYYSYILFDSVRVKDEIFVLLKDQANENYLCLHLPKQKTWIFPTLDLNKAVTLGKKISSENARHLFPYSDLNIE